MNDTEPPAPRTSTSRRKVLRAAVAGTGVAIAGSIAAAVPADAAQPLGTPITPVLPLWASQPKGTVLTLLGTAGGPQAEYVRTGTSSVLTIEGQNYVIDCGRSSVTQYLNSGLKFSALKGIFITHLHADHLADYYNYFLLEGGQANAEGDRLPPPRRRLTPGRWPCGDRVRRVACRPTTRRRPPSTRPIRRRGSRTSPTGSTRATRYSYNLFMRGDGYPLITDLQTEIHEIEIPASAGASYTNMAPVMDPFTIHQDDKMKISAILVPHGEVFPAFAYRFDTAQGSVVFSGDTSCPVDPNNPDRIDPAANNVIKLAQGADILVHEVMNWDLISSVNARKNPPQTVDNNPLLKHLRASHTTTGEVGQVATAAGVPVLVLTHLIPSNPLDCPDLLWKARSPRTTPARSTSVTTATRSRCPSGADERPAHTPAFRTTAATARPTPRTQKRNR